MVTALIAAVPPATAAVYGYISKSRELEIAKQKQDYDIRMAFLDRAIDPDKPPESRHEVLRFLETVMTDDAMKAWAKSELTSVDEELQAAKEQVLNAQSALVEKNRLLAEAESKRMEVQTALEQATASRSASKAQIVSLRAQLAAASEAVMKAEAKTAEAKAKSTSTSTPLKISCSPGTIEGKQKGSDSSSPAATNACKASFPSSGGADFLLKWHVVDPLIGDIDCSCLPFVRLRPVHRPRP